MQGEQQMADAIPNKIEIHEGEAYVRYQGVTYRVELEYFKLEATPSSNGPSHFHVTNRPKRRDVNNNGYIHPTQTSPNPNRTSISNRT